MDRHKERHSQTDTKKEKEREADRRTDGQTDRQGWSNKLSDKPLPTSGPVLLFTDDSLRP